jgi:hypothetical protein
MGKFSNNLTFKQLLDEKKQDILQRTSDGIQDTPQFQRLLSLLSEYRRKNKETDFRLVIISKSDLLRLSNDAEVNAANLFKNNTSLTNRIVYVDTDLSVIGCSNEQFPAKNNEARRLFASISKNDGEWIVFHIAPNATVNYFINGHDYGDGVFYTLEEQNNYEQLKGINQLQEVLDEYRISLTHQNTYLKFFVPRSGLHALYNLIGSTETEATFVSKHKYLLNNKPELLFHEDLRNYIKQHMKVFVFREVILENLDRLDIELIDERGDDLYFIEIKWVGESIASDGCKFGTEYKANHRIKPDAVRQVVGYIAELLRDRQNIKIGYLAVFDARKDDLPDTGEGITEADVSEELREYYPRFFKLKDFRVKNENPR